MLSTVQEFKEKMGRGVSSGGGQSSLGYLFGGNEAPAPKPAAARNVEAPAPAPAPSRNPAPHRNSAPAPNVVAEDKSSAVAPSGDAPRQIPAGIQGSQKNNNYFRADGQNTGNFLTVYFCPSSSICITHMLFIKLSLCRQLIFSIRVVIIRDIRILLRFLC